MLIISNVSSHLCVWVSIIFYQCKDGHVCHNLRFVTNDSEFSGSSVLLLFIDNLSAILLFIDKSIWMWHNFIRFFFNVSHIFNRGQTNIYFYGSVAKSFGQSSYNSIFFRKFSFFLNFKPQTWRLKNISSERRKYSKQSMNWRSSMCQVN